MLNKQNPESISSPEVISTETFQQVERFASVVLKHDWENDPALSMDREGDALTISDKNGLLAEIELLPAPTRSDQDRNVRKLTLHFPVVDKGEVVKTLPVSLDMIDYVDTGEIHVLDTKKKNRDSTLEHVNSHLEKGGRSIEDGKGLRDSLSRYLDRSREEFLKAAVVGIGGTVLLASGGSALIRKLGLDIKEAKSGLDWETSSYREIDFVNRPELLIDNPRLKERIEEDSLQIMEISDRFMAMASVSEGFDEWTVDREAWKGARDKLISTVFSLAQLIEMDKELGGSNLSDEISERYREYASYLRGLLIVTEETPEMDDKALMESLYQYMYFEGMDTLKTEFDSNSEDPYWSQRYSESHWAVDWESITSGQPAANPLSSILIDMTGDLLPLIPGRMGERFNTDRSRTHIERGLFGNASEAELVDLDAEVIEEVRLMLERYGVESGTNKISFPKGNHAYGITMLDEGRVEIVYPFEIDLEAFKKIQITLQDKVFHEMWHSLNNRSTDLADEEKLRFKVAKRSMSSRFDPLQDLSLIFNPPGEFTEMPYPGREDPLQEQVFFNEMDRVGGYMWMTEYYFEHLDGYTNNENMQQFRDNLIQGYHSISGNNSSGHLYFLEGDGDLIGILNRLGRTLGEMDPLSRAVSEVILENQELILARKRNHFHYIDHAYFTDQVLPLVLCHLAMYKPEVIIDAIAQESENPSLSEHFAKWWIAKLTTFIRKRPYEELTASVVGSLLGNDEIDIDWGSTKEDFEECLEILKKSRLAESGKGAIAI